MSKQKLLKIIIVAISGFYALLSSSMLIIVQIQKMFISISEKNEIDETFRIVHKLAETYMPYLFIIGIMYCLFSFILHKKFIVTIILNVVIGLINLSWAILYTRETFSKSNHIDNVITNHISQLLKIDKTFDQLVQFNNLISLASHRS